MDTDASFLHKLLARDEWPRTGAVHPDERFWVRTPEFMATALLMAKNVSAMIFGRHDETF